MHASREGATHRPKGTKAGWNTGWQAQSRRPRTPRLPGRTPARGRSRFQHSHDDGEENTGILTAPRNTGILAGWPDIVWIHRPRRMSEAKCSRARHQAVNVSALRSTRRAARNRSRCASTHSSAAYCRPSARLSVRWLRMVADKPELNVVMTPPPAQCGQPPPAEATRRRGGRQPPSGDIHTCFRGCDAPGGRRSS